MHGWMLAGCWLDASWMLAGWWLDGGWLLVGLGLGFIMVHVYYDFALQGGNLGLLQQEY
jgi:hypothetical protein